MKHIPGYADHYSVLRDGRIYSHKSGKFLRQKDSRGYKQVDLTRYGVTKTRKVHRLVAQAYIQNPDRLPQVNHIDGDKSNNSVPNLEWCSAKENAGHWRRNDNKSITYHRIKRMLSEGRSTSEIVYILGVNPSSVLTVKFDV